MKVVAFIPIKLNSVRLANKNLLPIAGHPMCWHIANTLCQVKNIDEVYVYCSNEEITRHIPKEAKFLQRSKQLDGDLVKGAQIYNAFIEEVNADIYVLAHTTSPFIKSESVESALNKILDETHDSAFSAQMFKTFAWYDGNPINYGLTDVPRTQDIEPVYIETSGFYMFKKEMFTENGRRIGDKPYIQIVDDIEAIDIDEEKDYNFAVKIAGT